MVQIDTFLRLEEHPNIVKFHGVAILDWKRSGGKMDTIFYLVLEYMPLGSLCDILHSKSQVLTEWLAAGVALAACLSNDMIRFLFMMIASLSR